jgi:hypothetical protein
MRIIIDIEDLDNTTEFLKEFNKSFKTGCIVGEVNEEFIKFKWRIE